MAMMFALVMPLAFNASGQINLNPPAGSSSFDKNGADIKSYSVTTSCSQSGLTFKWEYGENLIDVFDPGNTIRVKFKQNNGATRHAGLRVTDFCNNTGVFHFTQLGDPAACPVTEKIEIISLYNDNLCDGMTVLWVDLLQAGDQVFWYENDTSNPPASTEQYFTVSDIGVKYIARIFRANEDCPVGEGDITLRNNLTTPSLRWRVTPPSQVTEGDTYTFDAEVYNLGAGGVLSWDFSPDYFGASGDGGEQNTVTFNVPAGVTLPLTVNVRLSATGACGSRSITTSVVINPKPGCDGVNKPVNPVDTIYTDINQPFVVSTTVTGNPARGIQWYYRKLPGGVFVPVPGGTSETINRIEMNPGEYEYYARVWPLCDTTKAQNGDPITVIVCDAIQSVDIVGGNAMRYVTAGDPIVISITVVTQTNYNVQWFRRVGAGPFVQINGANQTTLSTVELVAGLYTYKAVVWSACGSMNTGIHSPEVPVTVTPRCVAVDSVRVSPVSINATPNTPFTITATVYGGSIVQYQWYRATNISGPYVPLAGQTNATLTMSESATGTYYYRVAAWSSCEPTPTGPNSNISTVTVETACIAVTAVSITPDSITVVANTPFSISAIATGGTNIRYQWYRASNPAGPYTAVTAVVTNSVLTQTLSSPGTYYYRVAAWSSCEQPKTEPTSNVSVVIVTPPCNVVTNVSIAPVSITTTVGATFTITATATGGTNIQYQWYRSLNPNGPYATVGSVTTNNILTQSEPAAGTFYYRVAAWSDCERPKTEPGSNITEVRVDERCNTVTSVTISPDSISVTTNTPFTITATAVGGTNIRYQWYRATNRTGPYTPIAGQTNVTLTMSESAVGTYYYRVAAWSSCEPAKTEPNSNESKVTVITPCRVVSSVTVTPDTINVATNVPFTITSNVVGGENVQYQWYRATNAAGPFVPVAGQTNSTITMSESAPGTYYYRVAAWSNCEPARNTPNSNTSVVRVTPYCSTVTSTTVTPTSITVTPNTPFTITANVIGGTNIQYQWYRSTNVGGPFVALGGQTSVTLTMSEPAEGTYYYRVAAWSSCEPVPSGPTSNTSTVTVKTDCIAVTSVTIAPTSINVSTGATFTITATAIGGTNVQYQWYRATNSAGPYTAITGVVTSNVLSRDEPTAGTYYFRVAAWSDCEQQPTGPTSNTSTVTVTDCNNVTNVTIAPVSITVTTNVTFTITSTVTGGVNVQYQWYRATSPSGPYAPVGGQTGSSLTISESSPGTYYYQLAAWSNCEPARTSPNSNTSTVTVTTYCDTVRTVTITPTSITTTAGTSFSITSNVVGGTNVRYQWYRATNASGPFSPIGGQTGSTLTMSEAASGTYYYRLAAWSECEPAKTVPNSNTTTVTVTEHCQSVTTVTVTPPSITVTAGTSFTVTANAVGGTNVQYQWYRATNAAGPYSPLAGQTGGTLTTSESTSGTYYYRVAAWSNCEQAPTEPNSNISTVIVTEPCNVVTSVTVSPASVTVATNTPFTITATAVGGSNIRYQWYRATNAAGPFVPVGGQTGVTLTISESVPGTYYYAVAAWSDCEPARNTPNSNTSTVTVTLDCNVVTDVKVIPTSISVVTGASFSITSYVTGGTNIQYQWYRSTSLSGPYTPIGGQTGSTLTTSESVPGTYYYRVAAWSDCEPAKTAPDSDVSTVTVTSDCAAVTVVTVTPTSINASPGVNFTITAIPTGGTNVQYRWYRATNQSGPYTAVTGVTSNAVLTRSEAAPGIYYYRVAAWSNCESEPTGPNSNASIVTVTEECDAVTSVTVSPTAITTTAGATFTITANAVGGTNIQYRWYRSTSLSGTYIAVTGVSPSNVLNYSEPAAGRYYYRVAAWSSCELIPTEPNSNTSIVTVTEACDTVQSVTVTPTSVNTTANASFTITANAVGGTNVQYQWYRATNIGGPYAVITGMSSSNVLTRSEPTPGTYYYRVAAWSSCELPKTGPTSDISTVTVSPACNDVTDVIVTPDVVNVTTNASFTLTANAVGGTNIQYQWYRATNSGGPYTVVTGVTTSNVLTRSEPAVGVYYYRVAAWSDCENPKSGRTPTFP